MNVNTGTQAALQTVSGVGEVISRRIIAARNEVPFATLGDFVERTRIRSAEILAQLKVRQEQSCLK